MKRLGLLIIGDEILAGHTQDTNTHWLAKRLGELGVTLARVETITDDVRDIKTSIQRFLHDLHLDYVVTSGGLGPTHDDRTMEGLAAALGTTLVLTADNKAWMAARVAEGHKRGYLASPVPNEGHRKMALLPVGATSMPNNLGTCLGAIIEAGPTLFTLPGVPREFERMFDETVAPLLEQGPPKSVEELAIYAEESRFYRILEAAEAEHGVTIGSYPQRGHILVRASGDKAAAQAAIGFIRDQVAEFLSPG